MPAKFSSSTAKPRSDSDPSESNSSQKSLPTLALNPAIRDVFDFSYEDIAIEGYDPAPAIKAPVAV